MKKMLAITLSLCLALGMALSVSAADTAKKYSFKSSLSEWQAKNSDIEAWLYIEGTNINYPVIFYPDDTSYYESLGYDKKPSRNGVIWAGANTKSGKLENMSVNTILFGHNWTNVSSNPRIGAEKDVMFAQLTAFHHLDFASKHQFINYSNSDGAYVFQVFAAFYTEDTFEYYAPNLKSDEFKAVVSGARARSLHNYDIAVNDDDKIITLSTCTRAFGPSDRQRFVVMGKMVPVGTEMVAVTANKNYQKPAL